MFQQRLVAENTFLNDIMATRQAGKALMAREGQDVALLQTLLTAEIACILRYRPMTSANT